MGSRLPFDKYSDYPNSDVLGQQFAHFMEVANKQLGFPWVGIVTIDKSAYPIPSFVRFSNMPTQWVQDYREQNLALVDPLLQHGLNSTRRLVWDKSILAHSPRFAYYAEKHRYQAGICQSMRDVFGLTHYVVLATDKTLNKEYLLQIDASVSHFMLSVQDTLEAFFMSIKSMEYTVLSARELEMLRWAAAGKTAAETAVILGLSERTVNFHLNNCAEKLHVNSKTQALLKALSLNIL